MMTRKNALIFDNANEIVKYSMKQCVDDCFFYDCEIDINYMNFLLNLYNVCMKYENIYKIIDYDDTIAIYTKNNHVYFYCVNDEYNIFFIDECDYNDFEHFLNLNIF